MNVLLPPAGNGWKRPLALLAVAAVLAGCANPWELFPDSAMLKSAQRRMAAPAPRVWANYCGLGTKQGGLAAAPLNELDRACLAHDICYIRAKPGCACDDALAAAAARIARDPAEPPDVRRKARQVRLAFSTGFCQMFPRGILPPRDPRLLETLPPGDPRRISPERLS